MIKQKKQREVELQRGREEGVWPTEEDTFLRVVSSVVNWESRTRLQSFFSVLFQQQKNDSSYTHYHGHSDVVANTGKGPPLWPPFNFPFSLSVSPPCPKMGNV